VNDIYVEGQTLPLESLLWTRLVVQYPLSLRSYWRKSPHCLPESRI